MKEKLIITTLAICIITIGSFTANAFHSDNDGYGPPIISESESGEKNWRGKHRQPQREMFTKLLGLSEEQQEQIKAIREEEKTFSEALRDKMREHRNQMQELSSAGTFDENAFRAIAEEKAETQVEVAVSRAQMHSKILAIMSPEQQDLAKKIRSLRHNKRGENRRGPGRREAGFN